MYSHPPSLGYQIAICGELFGKLSLEDLLYSLVSFSTAFQSFPKQYGGNKCSQTGCDYCDRLWYYIQLFFATFSPTPPKITFISLKSGNEAKE